MNPTAERILAGDLRALARAATAVENRTSESRDLLRELFPHTGRAVIIGITGAPGAGKSTLVDQFIRLLRAEAKTVGILAVDPSSPYTGGAILGDRVRMQDHHADPGVFIRSMATRGSLGGLAAATTDMALVLDAAGRDVVIVETVGVGQAEVEIAQLADVTVVVLVPGMGDDIQANKAGIMEIADVFALNKADHAGIDRLQREVETAQSFDHRPDGWVPPLIRVIASEGQGVAETLAAVRHFRDTIHHAPRTAALWTHRLQQLIRERLLERIPAALIEEAAARIARREQDPYSAAADILRYSCSFTPPEEHSH